MKFIKEKWASLEKSRSMPFYFNKLNIIDSHKILNIENLIEKEISEIIDNLYNGDVYLIKNVISKKFLNKLKEKLILNSKNTKSEFYKIIDGIPNFRRDINEDIAKKYSIKSVRSSYYFFRWNKDEFDLFNEFDPIWGSIKILGGLERDTYVNNPPSNGIVDRIQVVKYPPLSGYIEPHQHDTSHQRIIISIYMSKKGLDYEEGGTYFYKKNNNSDTEVEVENNIDVGDVGIFYGSLKHSVKAVKVKDLKADQVSLGRWWCGLYSPESNYTTNRKTSRPADK